MKPVRFSKLAKREIDSAAQWYENRQDGLGAQFYRRVDEAAEKIEFNPEGFQKLYKDLRRVNLEQFKDWGIWFRILPDNSLVITCLSGRRHPTLAQGRAAGVLPIKPEP